SPNHSQERVHGMRLADRMGYPVAVVLARLIARRGYGEPIHDSLPEERGVVQIGSEVASAIQADRPAYCVNKVIGCFVGHISRCCWRNRRCGILPHVICLSWSYRLLMQALHGQ